MTGSLDHFMETVNHGLAFFLGKPWAVIAIVGAMALGVVLIIVHGYLRSHWGMTRSLKSRLRTLRSIEGSGGDTDAQTRFKQQFNAIDRAMREENGSKSAIHAWLEYSETFFDVDDSIIKTTDRPDGYFFHLAEHTRVLAWWSNIFVALGLTATFLGIIGALTVTTDGLRKAGTDTAGMSSALTALLLITAAKFWTSIGGVGASIILRIVDRWWHSGTLKALGRIVDLLEKGTVYVPPQQIAADQLREMKQQTVALSEFSTQLAVGIADALQEKLAPVVGSLSGIQSSIDDFKSGSFDQIGKELGAAISQGAGTEMATLAAALVEMTSGIQGVNDRLEGASGQASEQIATAAREFSTASEHMTKAFATLNGRIEGMAERLAAQAHEAEERNAARIAADAQSYELMASGQRDVMRSMGEDMRAASSEAAEGMIAAVRNAVRSAMSESTQAMQSALEGFSASSAGINSAFEQMRGQVAELGHALTSGAEGAATRNADVLEKAALALESATSRTSTALTATLDQAITRASDESGRAITEAFASFGERFEQASAGLVETLRSASGRLEALALSIERSTSAADMHADKLSEAGREAQAVATMLGRAATDVSTAAAPIRDATSHIRDSVGQGHDLLKRAGEESTRQVETLRTLTQGLEQTSGAATRAWESYRDRFENLDDGLGRALDKIKDATAEHAANLNEQVGQIDLALAQAVRHLAGYSESLSDLAQELGDTLTRAKSVAR